MRTRSGHPFVDLGLLTMRLNMRRDPIYRIPRTISCANSSLASPRRGRHSVKRRRRPMAFSCKQGGRSAVFCPGKLIRPRFPRPDRPWIVATQCRRKSRTGSWEPIGHLSKRSRPRRAKILRRLPAHPEFVKVASELLDPERIALPRYRGFVAQYLWDKHIK